MSKLTGAEIKALKKYAASETGGYYKNLKIQWRIMMSLKDKNLISWTRGNEKITDAGRQALKDTER